MIQRSKPRQWRDKPNYFKLQVGDRELWFRLPFRVYSQRIVSEMNARGLVEKFRRREKDEERPEISPRDLETLWEVWVLRSATAGTAKRSTSRRTLATSTTPRTSTPRCSRSSRMRGSAMTISLSPCLRCSLASSASWSRTRRCLVGQIFPKPRWIPAAQGARHRRQPPRGSVRVSRTRTRGAARYAGVSRDPDVTRRGAETRPALVWAPRSHGVPGICVWSAHAAGQGSTPDG